MREGPAQSRRGFLAGTGAAGLTALAPGAGGAADRPRFIDAHHHYGSPAFAAFNRRFDAGVTTFPWDPVTALADMDAAGAPLALLSGFTPSTDGTREDRAALSRSYNEYGAGLVRDHPRRFALLATLPTPDIDASLKELAYAFDTLGAVGVTVYTDAADKWLGDPLFDPLYDELNRRKAVIFVHPHSPPCCVNLVPGVPDTFIEYGTATTRTIASLIYSGATRRHPDMRFIFSHGGGTLPFLIERFLSGGEARLDGVTVHGQVGGRPPLPADVFMQELRRMYFDTAQIANPVTLRAVKSVVGPSQILFGTDKWFRGVKETADAVIASGVFDAAELAAVSHENLLRLAPGLRSRLPA